MNDQIRQFVLLLDGKMCNEGYTSTSAAYALEFAERLLAYLSRGAEWKPCNVTLPNGEKFTLAISGDRLRIRKAGWWPVEIELAGTQNELTIKADTGYR